jgi:hypothetical protein
MVTFYVESIGDGRFQVWPHRPIGHLTRELHVEFARGIHASPPDEATYPELLRWLDGSMHNLAELGLDPAARS